MTMSEIKNIFDTKMSNVYEKHGAFFAFSEKQFNESKIEGVKYCDAGYGLLCPVDNAKTLIEEINTIAIDRRDYTVKHLGAKRIISDAFFDYETGYTGDTSDMMNSLRVYIKHYPELFTEELINTTIKECFKWDAENN